MRLVFKPPKLVDVLLFRLVLADDADSILFLIKRVDLMIHKVGDVFCVKFYSSDGAVFLLKMEKGFFHAEGGDGAGGVPDLASLLALFNVVLDGFGDGGGVFMGNGEGASGGMAGPGDVKGEVVFVHVSVE